LNQENTIKNKDSKHNNPYGDTPALFMMVLRHEGVQVKM